MVQAKTAVAAMAALMAINDGKQAVLMAPTELLARQHLETVNLMFKSIGLRSSSWTINWRYEPVR